MQGEIAATKEGKILALRTSVLADHGAFNTTAQPTKNPAGFFSIFTGSYDLQAAHCKVRGVYTNKAPGGVAYACSFRVTEAVYLVERMVDILARKLDMDPVELRLKNFIKPEQFPYANKTGWVYDSGNYEAAMRLSMEIAGYEDLRREQAEKRERGELMGIGVSFFTEVVGAGPRKHFDIVGLGMADGAELRVHPTGKAVVRLSVQSQGQGHETTFARSLQRSSASRRRTSTWSTATRIRPRLAWARTGAGRRPSAAAPLPGGTQGQGKGEVHRRRDA
ncbi:carbon monoxide dehydrogenase large chain [Arthrobacter sp. Hiyo6]|nr:carbon monoxide dehydrogenase large chain [Arthrobacter sp. Hiyo6]